ncbi:MAG TPA: PP2C family protein-serine/threonine phosphatase [Acidobacteriaceae bacterium]|nr:PP2C family protein-serine/threonine phosphatase [Acidobacteriaceae bacterium]
MPLPVAAFARLVSAAFTVLLLTTALPAQSIQTISPQQCVWHAGDNPAWAAPGMDESGWQPYTIWKPSREQPRLWIRCHANLASLQTVSEPAIQIAFPGAYDLFVNGQQLGLSGDLGTGVAETDVVRSWPVPRAEADASAVIALRGVYAGVHHAAAAARLEAGSLGELNAERDSHVLAAIRQDAGMAACYLLIGAIGLALLGFYLSDRSRKELLLLGVTCLALALLRLDYFAEAAEVPLSSGSFICFQAAQLILPVAEILFFFRVAGRRIPRGMAAALAFDVILNLVMAVAVAAPLYAGYRLSAMIFLPPSYPYEFLILFSWAVLLSGVLTAFWSPGRLSRRLQVLAALCGAWVAADSVWFAFELAALWHGSPFLLGRQYDMLAESRGYTVFALVVALMALLLWDQRKMAQERAVLAGEMQAAREIQRMLAPEVVDTAPGAQVEVAFRPMREVGGDFYLCRTLPNGRQRVLVGDVSGKGAAAAMTAALLVGAAERRETDSPAALLQHLNLVLHGSQVGGFATCLCADLAVDGTVTLANAGHLAPYCHAQEVAVTPSLPLGVSESDAVYEERRLVLAEGETLTFLSDGVVEARNHLGELFGFERAREISRHSAEEIARAAQAFGQQDDITVLTVTFSPAEVAHA